MAGQCCIGGGKLCSSRMTRHGVEGRGRQRRWPAVLPETCSSTRPLLLLLLMLLLLLLMLLLLLLLLACIELLPFLLSLLGSMYL